MTIAPRTRTFPHISQNLTLLLLLHCQIGVWFCFWLDFFAFPQVSVDGPTGDETDVSHCTIVSKLPPAGVIPADFEARARGMNALYAHANNKESSHNSPKLEICPK